MSVVSGGKGALLGDGSAGNAERGDERDPVGVSSGVDRGVEHQRPDRVVAAQVAPDLLEDQVGFLGAEHGPWAALMGFEFIEG